MNNVIAALQREDQFLQLISQAKFGNLERCGTISAVDNYTEANMCAYLHVYIYVIASGSRSGIRVPSPSRNVYLEIDGELLLDRVQPRRKHCIFGHARPSLSTNNISNTISAAICQGQTFALILSTFYSRQKKEI